MELYLKQLEWCFLATVQNINLCPSFTNKEQALLFSLTFNKRTVVLTNTEYPECNTATSGIYKDSNP